MSDFAIRYIGDLERLELKPGDRFVITADRPLSREVVDGIQRGWSQFVDGRTEEFKLLVLDGGLKLGVIGPEPQAGEAAS